MSETKDPPLEREPRPPIEHLQGIVERVTFHAEEAGYTVARLKTAQARDLITIVGSFPDIPACNRCKVAKKYLNPLQVTDLTIQKAIPALQMYLDEQRELWLRKQSN